VINRVINKTRFVLLNLAYRIFGLRWRLMGTINIGVRIMLLRGDTVVLVRHSYLPGWLLPGGGVKKLETLEQAARREALEEVGATTTGPVHLLGVFSNFAERKSDHVALFVCEEFTIDESVHSWEILQWCHHPIGRLPKEARRVGDKIELYRSGARGVVGKW